MMRKICLVTGTRADYGIMRRLVLALNEREDIQLQIIATNMHLSADYGYTYREIEADDLHINKKVEMLTGGDTPVDTVAAMGRGLSAFGSALQELDPDLMLILGDRYEMLVAASAATIMGIPVAHFHGGEITEGAYDDALRHAITKLSYLHFTATEEYRQRVIQMGESPERVFCVGALGVENIRNADVMPLDELEKDLNFKLGSEFLLVTFHPVTKEPGEITTQIESLLAALGQVTDVYNILFTLPNSDAGGGLIASMITDWVANHADKALAVKSLGQRRYFSALKHCAAVIGNSSSGLIEAPSFGVPTLNIGNRQKGRARGNTVIDCNTDTDSIASALHTVLSPEFRQYVRQKGLNPYYMPDTLKNIADILTQIPLSKHPVKSFYDIPNLQ